MEQKENVMENRFGDFLVCDVCAFCNADMSEGQKKPTIIDKLKAKFNGYKAFCWPGAILPVEWLAYRGAVGYAFVVEIVLKIAAFFIVLGLDKICEQAVSWVYFPISAIGAELEVMAYVVLAVLFIIAVVIMGNVSINLYYKYVCKCLNERGLAERPDTECPELSESLKKQGKPSVLRAIVFRLLLVFMWTCVGDVVLTLVNVL